MKEYSPMTIERLACVASRSERARQGLDILGSRYTLVPVEEALQSSNKALAVPTSPL